MLKFIPQMEPWFDDKEKLAISDYLDSGGWITEFKKTEEFEKMIAEYTGTKHCIAVNNGTVSLSLIAIAAGIKPGDEVIVPNFTMIASPNSIKILGAKPVFADVEKETLCLDLDIVKSAVTEKTKAVMLVSANGRYPKKGIEEFQRFCGENGLFLLEDSAQSLGSFYPGGKHIGSVGGAGSFSFSAPKIISTGQGGAIITNNDELNYKIRRLKDFGRSGGGLDIHDSIGWNFKFTDLQAVVGIEQMKKLDWRVKRKKEIFARYRHLLQDVEEVYLFDQDLEWTTPWFIDGLFEKRNGLMSFLKEKGIGSRLMYPPINKQEAYNVPGEHPVSNLVGEKGLWLPSQSLLTDEQIDYICGTIKEYYNTFGGEKR